MAEGNGGCRVRVSKRDRPAVQCAPRGDGCGEDVAASARPGPWRDGPKWSKCQCEQGQQWHSRSGRWSRSRRQCRRVYACKAGPSRAPRRGIEPSSTGAVGVRGTATMSAIRGHVVVVSVSGRGAAVTEGHVAVKSGRGRRVAVTVEVSVLVKLGRAVYCSVVWRRMIRWRPSPASAWRAWSGRSSKGLPRDGPGRVPQGPSCGKEVAASPGPGP